MQSRRQSVLKATMEVTGTWADINVKRGDILRLKSNNPHVTEDILVKYYSIIISDF